MLGTAFEMAIVGAMLVCPFLGLFYSWSQWQSVCQEVRSRNWRRAVGISGLVAVTLQAVLFIALWAPFNHHDEFVRRTMPFELLLALVAVLSIFICWKGKGRWWLLASSLLLCLDSFFVVLAELAY